MRGSRGCSVPVVWLLCRIRCRGKIKGIRPWGSRTLRMAYELCITSNTTTVIPFDTVAFRRQCLVSAFVVMYTI